MSCLSTCKILRLTGVLTRRLWEPPRTNGRPVPGARQCIEYSGPSQGRPGSRGKETRRDGVRMSARVVGFDEGLGPQTEGGSIRGTDLM